MFQPRTLAAVALPLLLTTGGVVREPAKVEKWSELASRRLTQGLATDDAELIFEALGAADNALRIDPHEREAIIRREAALKALHISLPYAIRGETSRTVGNRLREAVHQGAYSEVVRLVRAFPQEARTWAEGESFSEWAYGIASGRPEYASRELDVTRAVGRVLVSTSGDALVAEAVHAIDRAIADEDRHRIDALFHAHTEYFEATRRWPLSWHPRMKAMLERAAADFVRGRSPMALAAHLAAGNTDVPSSFSALLIVNDHANAPPAIPARFVSLRARQDWQQSLRLAKRGDFGKSGLARLRAIKAFDSLGEHGHAANLRNLEADILGLIGDRAASWRMRRSALASAEAGKEGTISEQILINATRDAITTRKWDVARSLASLVIDAHKPVWFRHSLGHTEALLMRSIAEWNAKDLTAANHDLQRAKTSIAAAAHGMDFILGWVEAVEEAMSAGKAPPQWDEAMALHLAREAAERSDLDLALTIFDMADLTDFGYVPEGLSERAYLDLLDLADSHDRTSTAFRLNEDRLAHFLLARMGYGDAPILSADEIRERLPSRTAIISFVSLDDRLLTFTIDHDGFRISRKTTRRDELIRRMSVFTTSVRQGANARSIAMGLYQLLLGDQPQTGTLVIVPDQILTRLPFAALVNPGTGHYLTEEAAIVIAPSAGVFAKLTSTPKSRLQTALILGDPAFDQEAHQALARLPDAAAEAKAIGHMYRSAVLTGANATAAAFLARLSEADVTHVASHVVIDERDPMQSGIVMADRSLSIRDMLAQHAERGSLAVLVGCRSAERNGESDVGSLALAFLAAGSRSSVGALWDVDDAVTRRFSIRLHTLLRAGVKVSEAVRQTQVQMLRSHHPEERNTHAWAGFQVYGGD